MQLTKTKTANEETESYAIIAWNYLKLVMYVS